MSNFKPTHKSLNKNNGAYSTLDNSLVEGFVEMGGDPADSPFVYSDFGYSKDHIDPSEGQANPKEYARDAIEYQINPMIKLNERFNHLDSKIAANKSSLSSNMTKYIRLRNQLEEIPDPTERTINVGVSPDSNKLYFDVPNVDMSYQRLKIPATIDKTNEASSGVSFNIDHTFSVKAEGKTLIIQKETQQDRVGWNVDDGYTNGLQFNIGIETIPDKKYFHHKDDPLEINRRKNQREQHMSDTKELLLYTNQFYIIGTISTALVLIFAYRNVA